MKNSHIVIVVGIAILIGVFAFVWIQKEPEIAPVSNNTQIPNSSNTEEYVSYKNSEYSPEFSYPKSWGEVTIEKGNTNCPEEDTYRTQDSLHVFDWEFSFPERKIPGSESFIRSGVRTYELDPKKLNNCGDEFLLKIARKEVNPQTISSFIINPLTNPNGLTGTYNIEASRLNTESRRQYTFFVENNSKIYVIQAYTSFIPYFGSPELIEMETKFNGDMATYLRSGQTAEVVRQNFSQLESLALSLKFTGE